jgi:hypothetical protein
MSKPLILRDAKDRPDLFDWEGPIAPDRLKEWERAHGRVPPGLLLLWERTGGGTFLETETLLSPFGDPSMGDAVVEASVDLSEQGLPDHLLLFHRGTAVCAFDTRSGELVELDPSALTVTRKFASLDEWYRLTVRDELGPRYKLPNPGRAKDP